MRETIWIDGLPSRFEPGLRAFADAYGFQIGEGGLRVTLRQTLEKRFQLVREDDTARITYCQPVQIFRALSMLSRGSRFTVDENVYFDHVGPMVDGSQAGALMTVESVFFFLRTMAAMGLNELMLYCEDCFDVEGEPYFGCMRPRYTQSDLRAIDDYAYALGIEVIPCIQTLAHLPEALKWSAYADIAEDETTLLVGEEGTYRLIERMLLSASAPFRSRRIHIGMDEAWKLGQGNYLLKHGLEAKHSIFQRHLSRVQEIVEKLGLRPMMWGDMFFRSILPKNGYYTEDALEIPASLKQAVPPDMSLIYWDYYSERHTMENMTRLFRQFDREVIFAGAIRNNRSYGANDTLTRKNIDNGLPMCKAQGIRHVLATIWGDLCPESSAFVALWGLQWYAEHGYCEQPDEARCVCRFRECTFSDARAFEALKYMDEIPEIDGEAGNQKNHNVSRWLMWQDPLLGLLDANIEGIALDQHYRLLSEEMGRYAKENPAFERLFSFYQRACEALEFKSLLGVRLTRAYREKDAETVDRMLSFDIPETARRVRALCDAHRDLWMRTNKPVGWEVLDIRYGGVLARLETAEARLSAWRRGEIDQIPELQEARLPFDGKEGLIFAARYARVATAGTLG